MIRNFIVTSLRTLWRNKLVSGINILSLSIGITSFILILLYVHHVTSYDKFNKNYDRIYRLEGDEYARLPPIIGDYIRDRIPEIEHITQIQIERNQKNYSYISDNPGNSASVQTILTRADSSIFNVFTLPFIHGDPRSALNQAYTIVLTESFATKLFGDSNPIGETIIVDNQFRINNEYRVSGVIKDVKKSHLKIDALISRETLKESQRDMNQLIGNNSFWNGTYLLLTKHADPEIVQGKINKVLTEINNGDLISVVFKNFYLRSMKDLYLEGSATKLPYGEHGNKNLLWSFMVVAFFVLLLAITNYINLTTARSMLRSKEVIIKKVMGSSSNLLRQQFIAESILVTLIAFLIALTTIQLLIPKFNEVTQVHISLLEFNTPYYWTILLVGILGTGVIAGIYPALMLTKFRSFANIKLKSINSINGVQSRRLLLTFQFSISIVLIVGVITNLRQLEFSKSADLGFNKEQVVVITTPVGFTEQREYRERFKERLLQYHGIQKAAFSSRGPGRELGTGTMLEIDGTFKNFRYSLIDPDYLELMGIDILEGRNFSWDRINDSIHSEKRLIIINETAAQEYWSESPIGRIIRLQGRSGMSEAEIIGVTKDFHFLSMHHKIEPMMFLWVPLTSYLNVKISPANIPETIKSIEKEWKSVYGSKPFVYSFLNEEFDAQFKSDERGVTIIGCFTVLAIVIACMGLFALSSFMAVRRTKEIGIRKALGASSKTIFVMLSREYIKWILLSSIIASPIAWFAMNNWLETFAYRIELGPWVFIIAAVIALAIGLITVGWQALKSAVANPVEALRYE